MPPCEHDPFVAPDWRHLRAIRLVAAGKKANHPRDDDASTQAWPFYRSLQRCTRLKHFKALASSMPAHYEAREFFTSAASQSKAEVEARFLAGQDDEAIATCYGISPAAVGVYHDCYFSVRARLACEGYILHVVLGSRLHRGLTEADREVVLSLFAYLLGSVGLDALLFHYAQPPLALNEVMRLDTDAILALGDRLRCQALVHFLTMTRSRPDQRAAALLHNLLTRLRTAEESMAQQAPALRVMDGTVFQRLEAAGTRRTEETLIDLGPTATGLQGASAVAGAMAARLELRVAGDASDEVYDRDLRSCQPSKPVTSGHLVSSAATMAMAS